MGINIGSTGISSLYLGSTEVTSMYVGSTKVYESAPAGVVIGGKTYPTVVMPDGKEWITVNLDYAYPGLTVATSNVTSVTTPQAVYTNCDEATYGWSGYRCGLLYNWYAVDYMEQNKSTLFPGWHIATDDEWFALVEDAIGVNVAGTKLKAVDGSAGTSWPTGWNGTDDYGFSVLPTGEWLSGYNFYEVGVSTNFFTSSSKNTSTAYVHYFSTAASVSAYPGASNKGNYLPVRLVKDST